MSVRGSGTDEGINPDFDISIDDDSSLFVALARMLRDASSTSEELPRSSRSFAMAVASISETFLIFFVLYVLSFPDLSSHLTPLVIAFALALLRNCSNVCEFGNVVEAGGIEDGKSLLSRSGF